MDIQKPRSRRHLTEEKLIKETSCGEKQIIK